MKSGKIAKFIFSNAPTILTALAVVGVAATAVSASRDTERHRNIVRSEKPETQNEKFKCLVKGYWRTGVVGGVTVGCIVSSNRLSAKQIATLTTIATAAEAKFGKYRKKIVDRFGKELDREIYSEIAKEDWTVTPQLPFDEEGKEEVMFFLCAPGEPPEGRCFRATTERVQQAIYHLNRQLQLKQCVLLNELYNFIGIEETDTGNELGWSLNYFYDIGYDAPWIDIYSSMGETEMGVKYWVLTFDQDPTVKALQLYE